METINSIVVVLLGFFFTVGLVGTAIIYWSESDINYLRQKKDYAGIIGWLVGGLFTILVVLGVGTGIIYCIYKFISLVIGGL